MAFGPESKCFEASGFGLQPRGKEPDSIMIAVRSCRLGAGRQAPCVGLGISPAAKGLSDCRNPAQREQGSGQPLVERQARGGLKGDRRLVAEVTKREGARLERASRFSRTRKYPGVGCIIKEQRIHDTNLTGSGLIYGNGERANLCAGLRLCGDTSNKRILHFFRYTLRRPERANFSFWISVNSGGHQCGGLLVDDEHFLSPLVWF